MNFRETQPGSALLQPFYPALDGLRAVAFLCVFAYHYEALLPLAAFTDWGWIGVDLFFVISGFLITGILCNSLDGPRYFRNFYIRRALRILPIFYTVWLAAFLLTPLLHIQWNRYVLSMAVFAGNFFMPGFIDHVHASPGIIPYLSARHPGQVHGIIVDHFWSLCVEEHFYLLWPGIVWLVRSRRTLLWLSIAGIVLTPLARTAAYFTHPNLLSNATLYFNTAFRFDTLLFGAALWLGLNQFNVPALSLRRAARITLIGAPLILLVARAFERHPPIRTAYDPVVNTIGFSLIALAATAAMLLSIFPGSLACRLLGARPFSAIGRISYGLYIFHQLIYIPVLGFAATHPRCNSLCVAAAFVVSLALAVFSFRWIESPFLRLKHTLAPRPGAMADPPRAGTQLHPEPGPEPETGPA